MSERSTDALELLLPEAPPQFWQRAQRVTTFLRLLSDDARGGASIAVSLARARGVFERSASERCIAVHEELLRHHLYALSGCDSFAHFGECESELQEAWSALEEGRGELDWIPRVPAPDEGAADVAARLCDGLERAGASSARVAVWRARLEHAVRGPGAGESAFEALLAQPARAHAAEPQLRAAALAGAIECRLDRAAVRAARARLDAEGPRVLSDPRLRRLAAWTRILCGDIEGARRLPGGASFTKARLPRPLAELRARVPALAPWLSGQAAAGEPRAPAHEVEAALELAAARAREGAPQPAELHARSSTLDRAAARAREGTPQPAEPHAHTSALERAAARARTSLGAALFSAWTLEGPGRAKCVALAAAPALQGRVRAWLAAGEGACADPQESECQLLGDARTRILHGDDARHAIDPASILAVAFVALRNEHGDAAGWLNLQFEHQLVPSQARLERLAREWSQAPRAAAADETVPVEIEDESSSAALVLRGFVDGLALKTAQRRWSAFDVRESGLRLVAQGGGALDQAEEAGADNVATQQRGGGRAVARAAATGRTVAFAEADAELGLHRAAASGVAVPLALRGRVAGVWLVESTRRRDFSAADVQRFEARAAALAAELAAAQFRAWHRARYGHDAHVDAAPAGLSAEHLIALARSPAPIGLSGPPGSGRRMLARRLHFEGPLRSAPLRRVACEPGALERCLAPGAEPAGLILERALELPPAEQAALARLVEERGDARSRIYLLCERSLVQAVEQAALVPELAWAFSQVELHLEPLARRRREIAPLAALFVAHFAAEERVRAPELDDSAHGFLWRQPWSGNVRELSQWMYRLVLCHPGERADAELLEVLGSRFGHTPLRRVPSRHPERELVASALACTAHQNGTWNKTRAALYLGWDTDTLQSRISDAGFLAGTEPQIDGDARDGAAPSAP